MGIGNWKFKQGIILAYKSDMRDVFDLNQLIKKYTPTIMGRGY